MAECTSSPLHTEGCKATDRQMQGNEHKLLNKMSTVKSTGMEGAPLGASPTQQIFNYFVSNQTVRLCGPLIASDISTAEPLS